jgi:hypothetical protein
MEGEDYQDYGDSSAAIPPLQQAHQSASMLPLLGSIPYQQNKQSEGMLSQHLQTKELLDRLRMMLMSKEWDEEQQKWMTLTKTIYIDNKPFTVEIEPKMEPNEIRSIMSYMDMMLNSNTFLSYIDAERANNIAVDHNMKIMDIIFALRNRLSPAEKSFIWGALEYPVIFGLARAQNKITLDAVSKSQHTIESIQLGDKKQTEQPKQHGGMKLFGF